MNASKINIITLWIVRFVRIQLFMTLISFPILVSWGIPLSGLSLLGNLIFSPILTLFLLLCSLTFFGELIGLPTGLFIWLLEYISSCWCWLLALPSNRFLIGFSTPPFYLLILVPVCVFVTLLHKKTRTLFTSTFIFALLVFLIFLFCSYCKKSPCSIEKIPCNRGHVTLINTNNTLVLIDPGVIGQRVSACSWLQYTLLPHIIKTTGKTQIDHVILLQPNKTTFDAAALLSNKMQIKNIYLPVWKGSFGKSSWSSFFHLKETIEKNNTNLIRIGDRPSSFMLNKNSSVVIDPLQQKIKKTEINYSAYKVNWQIKGTIADIQAVYSVAYKQP